MKTIIAPAETPPQFGDARLPERFWAKIQRNETSTCWEWIGQLSDGGYARISVDGRMRRGHRLAYETLVGSMPDGLVLDHLCRVRNCVNPSHLEPVTPAENSRRGVINVGRKGMKLTPRTHCPAGHPYDEANTRIRHDGRRQCRACTQARRQRYRQAAPPSTLDAVFRAAARLIAVNGHHQGDYLPDPFDRTSSTPHAARPLCIVAALRCAVSGDPHTRTELSERAVRVLAHRLFVDGEPPYVSVPSVLETHVLAWGDVEGRHTETVVAVLEAAGDAVEVAA